MRQLVLLACAGATRLPGPQLVSVLVSMTRLRWQPQCAQLDLLKAALAPQLVACTAQQVAAALSALSALRSEVGPAWGGLAIAAVELQLERLGANPLGLVVFRIGRSATRPPDAFFERVSAQMSARIKECRSSPQALARCLHGMAAAGYRPPGSFLELWFSRSTPLLRTMDDYSLVLLAQALHRPLMRVTPQAGPFLARLYHHIVRALPAFHACCVSALMHCTLTCPAPFLPHLLDAATLHLSSNLPAYTATPTSTAHLGTILVTLCRHRRRPPPALLAAVSGHMIEFPARYPAPSLTAVLSAVPFLSTWQLPSEWFPAVESLILTLHFPRSPATLDAACGLAQAYATTRQHPPPAIAAHMLASMVPDPSQRSTLTLPIERLAQTLWLVSVLQPETRSPWLARMLQAAGSRLAAARQPIALVQLAAALCRLSTPPASAAERAFLERLALAVLTRLHAFTGDQCCRLLAALAALQHRPSARWLHDVTEHAAADLECCPLWLVVQAAAAVEQLGEGLREGSKFGGAVLQRSQVVLQEQGCTGRLAAALLVAVAQLQLQPGSQWRAVFLRVARSRLQRLPAEELPPVEAAAEAVGGPQLVQQLQLGRLAHKAEAS